VKLHPAARFVITFAWGAGAVTGVCVSYAAGDYVFAAAGVIVLGLLIAALDAAERQAQRYARRYAETALEYRKFLVKVFALLGRDAPVPHSEPTNKSAPE
jgi:hypothetical protein